LLGIGPKEAAEIHDGKEQIADFFVDLRLPSPGNRIPQFRQLFLNFIDDIVCLFPVEADVCGPFGDPLRPDQGGKGKGVSTKKAPGFYGLIFDVFLM